MPIPRAVIFDLDGTLADTFPLIVAAWNAAVSPVMGRSYSAAEVMARFGVSDTAMIEREVPRDSREEAVARYYDYYRSNHGIVRPFPGVPELLSALRERGVPLGLMTGKGRRSATITLEALGWQSLFQSVVTGEDAPKPKPAPDGLLMVARQLGVGPESCIWIGDSPADMKAGKAAGMYTIAAGWHEAYKGRIEPLNPDRIAQSPAEVHAVLMAACQQVNPACR